MDVCNSLFVSQLFIQFMTISFVSLTVISINQANVNNSTFTWALISRRSIERAGTRFFRRGIDKDVSKSYSINQVVMSSGGKGTASEATPGHEPNDFQQIHVFFILNHCRVTVPTSSKPSKLSNIWTIKFHLYKSVAVFHCIGPSVRTFATSHRWILI